MGANIGFALFDASGPFAWWSTLSSALAGSGFLLLCFGLLSVIGLLGFGDAKLLAAVGLCVRLPLALRVAPCVMLSGGVVALLLAVRGGKLRAVLRNLTRMRGLLAFQRVDEPAPELHLFPFATAIALGTTWAVAGRYLPVIAPF
jgi:Flp pilus assembly protein protease CpaA